MTLFICIMWIVGGLFFASGTQEASRNDSIVVFIAVIAIWPFMLLNVLGAWIVIQEREAKAETKKGEE